MRESEEVNRQTQFDLEGCPLNCVYVYILYRSISDSYIRDRSRQERIQPRFSSQLPRNIRRRSSSVVLAEVHEVCGLRVVINYFGGRKVSLLTYARVVFQSFNSKKFHNSQ